MISLKKGPRQTVVVDLGRGTIKMAFWPPWIAGMIHDRRKELTPLHAIGKRD